MGRPHPIELRQRVVAFVEEGGGHREAARHFHNTPKHTPNLGRLPANTGERWRP